ncbi:MULTISPECIES: type VI secretion system tube protein TssD [Enterobacterales]|uniref:type VI secretion system tube protein TssD n=1 Tax=Enterobacterales TaxID=91347 RepID=UPI002ED7D923
MSDLVYLTLNGRQQGLISSGCASVSSIGNKAQLTHVDQIVVYALKHALSRVQNVNHQELSIVKPLDKSSPLLGKAINDDEERPPLLNDMALMNGTFITESHHILLLMLEKAREIVNELLGSASVIGPLTLLFAGIFLNAGLNFLDRELHFSDYLKAKLKPALSEQQRILQWNREHNNAFFIDAYGSSW